MMIFKSALIHDKRAWIQGMYYDWSLAIAAQTRNGITRIDEPLAWHRAHDKEVTILQKAKFSKERVKKLTWQPYFFGYFPYQKLQRKSTWKHFYRFVFSNTGEAKFKVQNEMAQCMLSRNLFHLLKLCYLCLKHRYTIYPIPTDAHGLKGIFRAFFYPIIWAYENPHFDL